MPPHLVICKQPHTPRIKSTTAALISGRSRAANPCIYHAIPNMILGITSCERPGIGYYCEFRAIDPGDVFHGDSRSGSSTALKAGIGCKPSSPSRNQPASVELIGFRKIPPIKMPQNARFQFISAYLVSTHRCILPQQIRGKDGKLSRVSHNAVLRQ